MQCSDPKNEIMKATVYSCGSCLFWNKKKDCPREIMHRSPSSDASVCDKFRKRTTREKGL